MGASEGKARWASQRRVPRASRACETCRARKTKAQAQSPSLLRGRLNTTPKTTIASAGLSDTSQISNTELGDAASRDGLSGVNLHTNGTEFYGNSSNLAFLGNLYARAHHQELRDQPRFDETSRQIPASHNYPNPPFQPLSPETRHNKDYIGHPSPQSHDGVDFTTERSPPDSDGLRNRTPTISNDQDTSLESLFPRLTESAQVEIEKTFIGSYFANKHYIHPLLSKGAFMQRCEDEAWPIPNRQGLFRGATKFAGLYFAVVALGAINASPNETSLLEHFCQQFIDPSQMQRARRGPRFTALDFAKFFFGLAKRTLGDVFESSCLESAQTLLLLSVFRQNSLQPHSCYMYSGMAVRTAAAIGLGSSMSSLPPSVRREARRTWWCIYSHEIEMCCSSGRLDSMKELHYYQTSLPKLKVDSDNLDPDAEDNDIAMIPAMVSLAQIMSEASHQLYHSMRRSIADKSRLAMALDQRLLEWKETLPDFLNLDAHALNDPEWAFKQKLVLRLRYYNTRILIHRPFLVAATANTGTSTLDLSVHLHTCLTAARMSINMQYESFMHMTYIRTWWYNTTYALYGSMILLHLILSNYPGLPDDELLEDVEKSLEIFSSMGDIIVARRCAEMLREVLEAHELSLDTPSSILEQNTDLDDGDFFFSLFSNGTQTQPDRTRAEMLANLVDPSVLEDFAFGGGNEFSFF
ncbi:transcriptional regulator family: Fungal Specific TF [Penicillium crustosum]|uniref:transcriptional regulator family: Fungal Specific TF n=1 Tax=Penicillium crustosum TaxID=36656 RepID=UPI002392A4A8|nr:transcriptional regulator family: Fungal Specific TF [Penicillium crustosum]KAJ5395622.1 transcriptional regulator family: Fungal Specific TF [Penicillium crustosum]